MYTSLFFSLESGGNGGLPETCDQGSAWREAKPGQAHQRRVNEVDSGELQARGRAGGES